MTTGGPAIGRELAVLEGAGLITLAATEPDLEYLFRHVLIQDAAYDSLLRQERRELHARAAEVLLELYPDHRDDLAPVLAHHFERADDRPRAIEFLGLAAERARARFARHEAVDLAARAVTLLGTGDLSLIERRRRAELRLIQAEAGADFTPLGEGLALLAAVIDDAEAVDDTALAARAYLESALARALGGDQYRMSPDLAHALDRAESLAEASGSAQLVGLALAARGESRYGASEFHAAIELMERAIPMLIDTGLLYHASMIAGKLGTTYGHVGAFDDAVAWTDRAYELGEASGDPNASLDADLARSVVEGLRGDPTTAIEFARRAATEAERVDNKACAMVAHTVVGEELLKLGDPLAAVHAFQASADLATFCEFMPVKIEQTELLLQAARAEAGVGQVEFERYERVLELAHQIGDQLAEGQLFQQRAQDRIRAGQSTHARTDLARAAEIFERIRAAAHLRQVRDLEATLSTSTPRPPDRRDRPPDDQRRVRSA